MKTCSPHIKIYEIFKKKLIDGFQNLSIRIWFLLISFSLLPLTPIPAQNEWRLLGLEDISVEYVYAKGDTIWAGVLDYITRKVYYSYNGGDEWIQVADTSVLIGGWLNLLRVDPNNSLTIYANTFNGRGLKSKDGGSSWQYLIPEAEPWAERTRVKKLYISPHNQNVLFSIVTIGSYPTVDYLYRTTNGGITWDNLGAFLASSHGNELSFAFDPVDSARMYVSGYDNYLNSLFFVSYDFGNNWSVLSNNFSHWIIIDWSNNNIIYLANFRSDNGGYTWKRIMEGIMKPGLPYQPWLTSFSIDPLNPSVLYASISEVDSLIQAAKTLGIYKTTDRGELWSLMEGSESLELSNSTGRYPEHLFIDSTTKKLYVGTKKGLYKYDLLTSIEHEKENIPNKFILHQNYPNPFNPTTTIEYSVPVAKGSSLQNVSLIVYDLLGNEIVTLVNEAQNPGNYVVTFDASSTAGGLSSGIYYFQLKAGNFNVTKKMILLK